MLKKLLKTSEINKKLKRKTFIDIIRYTLKSIIRYNA